MTTAPPRLRHGALAAALVFALTTSPVALAVSTALGADDPPPYGDISGLKLVKPEDRVDALSTPPPPGAVVLFDGTDLDQWRAAGGSGPARWKLVGGAMQAGGGNIATRRDFGGHFRLHVEFRVPYMPKAKGQARGNSGVYLQGRYEVQVLDSYGLESQNNDCGAVYEVAAPKVNACKAPTVWQSYDIDFRAPVFRDGRKVTPARVSVVQNGQEVQHDTAIPVGNTRAGLGGDPAKPGPVMLQDHGNPVQYRNIWLVPLD